MNPWLRHFTRRAKPAPAPTAPEPPRSPWPRTPILDRVFPLDQCRHEETTK